MIQINLTSLLCAVPDEIDKDEVYLKHLGKKIWPKGKYKKIDSGEQTEINLSMMVEAGWVIIELWDFDLISANDNIGEFRFKVDIDQTGKYSTSMKPHNTQSTASYILNWEIK